MFIDLKHTYKSYQEIIDNYGKWEFICPKCKAYGHFQRHGIYSRFLCVIEDDCIVEQRLQILRLKCKACQSTHAVLTTDMIPGFVYSFSLMLDIIRSVLVESVPVLKKEKETSISFQMIYHFLQLWQLFISKYISLHILDSLSPFQNCYVQFLIMISQRKKLKKYLICFEVICPHSF